MILKNNEFSCETGNIGASTNFSINASPHAFRILSDGLYSDKITAIIRELSCNAYDAHVATGNKDKPFDLVLPTIFEQHFSIRDYGTGLSEDEVLNLYSTYFMSTKQDSNDYIGALGLGSKSPFSYTDSFTVESYYNKVKSTYVIFINSAGFPTISKVQTQETTEDNGLKISIEVQTDISEWHNKAKKVLQEFNPLPKCNLDITSDKNVLYQHNNFDIRQRNYSQERMYIKQGNILYPLNIDKCSIKPLNFNGTLVLYANIGDIEFTASRESISYTKNTIDNISKIIHKYNLDITHELTKIFNDTFKDGIAKESYIAFNTNAIVQQFRDAHIRFNYGDITIEMYELKNYNIKLDILINDIVHYNIIYSRSRKSYSNNFSTYIENIKTSTLFVNDVIMSDRELKYHFKQLNSLNYYIFNIAQYNKLMSDYRFNKLDIIKLSTLKLSKEDMHFVTGKKTVADNYTVRYINTEGWNTSYLVPKKDKIKGYYINIKDVKRILEDYRPFIKYILSEFKIDKLHIFNAIEIKRYQDYCINIFDLLKDKLPELDSYISTCSFNVNNYDSWIIDVFNSPELKDIKKEFNIIDSSENLIRDPSGLASFLKNRDILISANANARESKLFNAFPLLKALYSNVSYYKKDVILYILEKNKLNKLKEK